MYSVAVTVVIFIFFISYRFFPVYSFKALIFVCAACLVFFLDNSKGDYASYQYMHYHGILTGDILFDFLFNFNSQILDVVFLLYLLGILSWSLKWLLVHAVRQDFLHILPFIFVDLLILVPNRELNQVRSALAINLVLISALLLERKWLSFFIGLNSIGVHLAAFPGMIARYLYKYNALVWGCFFVILLIIFIFKVNVDPDNFDRLKAYATTRSHGMTSYLVVCLFFLVIFLRLRVSSLPLSVAVLLAAFYYYFFLFVLYFEYDALGGRFIGILNSIGLIIMALLFPKLRPEYLSSLCCCAAIGMIAAFWK